ncbi:MAG: septal ring lytic transglycosylase RlpA family protein [Alphaproteobacteria bacterium]|nr:septal ring lytic transglycosylase RlpA family protein [Alphaproteobacteria bacterium]
MDRKISKVIGLSFITLFGAVSCSSGVSLFESSPSSGNISSASSGGVYKVGTPYQVGGVWYYPGENYSYVEEGVASWYGPDFHNGTTANGETYDMYALTAAHRTLPLPSIVKVTNLENGRSLLLRVNDRGPFVNNRIIDVSKKAAQLLDFHTQGTTRVRVEIMPEESRQIKEAMLYGTSVSQNIYAAESSYVEETVNTQEQVDDLLISSPSVSSNSSGIRSVTKPPAQITVQSQDERFKGALSEYVKPKTKEVEVSLKKSEKIIVEPIAEGGLYIQAGAFSNKANAERMVKTLSNYGSAKINPMEGKSGKTLHRVRLGPFEDSKGALETLDKLKAKGYKDARIVEEKVIKKVTTKAVKIDSQAGSRLDKEF